MELFQNGCPQGSSELASNPATDLHGSARDCEARRAFDTIMVAGDYPCVGAASVYRQNRATVRGYKSLATPSAARQLLADLAEFDKQIDLADGFASFVAVFIDPVQYGEVEFETALWRQLGLIRAIDEAAWDPTVASNPEDSHFSFSAAGRAYFVIGLHPSASRPARRAPHPMLVFNPHEQFQRLRATGSFDRIRDINRRRDLAFSGSINPMVDDFGDRSEAVQYSGREVGDDWRAPFADPRRSHA